MKQHARDHANGTAAADQKRSRRSHHLKTAWRTPLSTTDGANANAGSSLRSFLPIVMIIRIPIVYCIAQHLCPAWCGMLMNHTIATMMTSLMANDNWVVLLLVLLFCSERFFTCKNDANIAPVRIHRTCFSGAILRKKHSEVTGFFCVGPLIQFRFTVNERVISTRFVLF